MKAIVCLVALSGIAFADDVSPPGRYKLEGRGPLELQGRGSRPAPPSCGQHAVDFLTGMQTVRIEAGADIRVNGTIWPRLPHQVDHALTVYRTDLLEGLVVELMFRRHGKTASGGVIVLGLDADGDVRCGDARSLAGVYRR